MITRLQYVFLLLAVIFSSPAGAEEASQAIPDSLHFKANKVSVYVYQSKQTTKQQINNDKVELKSEITWQFALRCIDTNEQNATLRLTIQAIKAKVDGPAFQHSIASNDPDSTYDTPVIGHLLILNGQSLDLVYDYEQQRLSKLSGAERIHTAFEKIYKPNPVSDEPHEQMAIIKQQYSNEALLRLWSEIIRPGASDSDTITLPAPLNLPLQRSWKHEGDIASYKYQYQPTNDEAAPTIELNPGSKPIEATLQSLKGSGQIRVEDGDLLEAKGSNIATMRMRALTQSMTQELDVSWQLLRIQSYQADTEASEKIPAE